jgi:hypothetical protein
VSVRAIAAARPRSDLVRLVLLGLIGGMVAYGAIRLVMYARAWDDMAPVIGFDYRFVMAQAERVRAGGPMYGPINGVLADLYPPVTVVGLFIPMSFAPAILWWAIPLAITGWVVWKHRPSLLGWTVIAALFIVWPHTWTAIQLGNTVMWIAAFAALGTLYGWPYALVLLKPSLAPLALLGVRSRVWWIAVADIVGVCLILWPLTVDWLDVVRAYPGAGLLYSAHDLGFVLIPVVAWLTSVRGAAAPDVERQVVGEAPAAEPERA